jgi:hypothetical protein
MKRKVLYVGSLVVAITLLSSFAIIPAVNAYGKANWQTAFAGTFITPGQGSSGFWGWCDFGGGTGSPATSGTDSDCQVATYTHVPGNPSNFQVHESISGTAWDEEPCTFPPCLTTNDFFITAGTMTISGPTVVQALKAGVGGTLPPSCKISGSTVTCSLSDWELLGIYNPDTGVPTAAGHFNLNAFLGQPGEFQIQVNQLS